MRNSMKSFEIFIRILKISLFYGFVLGIFASCASDDSALKDEVAQLRKELRDVKVELNKKDPDRFPEPEPEPEETVNVSPATGKTYKNSIGMEFIEIPAGEFLMGCSKGDTECSVDEKPQHKVKITKSFYIGRFEVTQGQWKKVMGNNPSHFANCAEECPVEQVSWNDIQDYIGKLCEREKQSPCKYRLPTEAEWEYAARAGVSTRSPTGGSKYYWGDTINDAYLWYVNNSGNATHPVGKKKPNAWELYDMSGNVWEWVGDWYDSSYYKNSPSADPKGGNSGGCRSLRGGSWIGSAKSCRFSYRNFNIPVNRNSYHGFRLVLLP
jgi:formylglycine-generating enzyme required for sulfatase activity